MTATTPPRPGVGVGFEPVRFDALVHDPSRLDFVEAHAENDRGPGGPPHAQPGALRQQLSLLVHGVGLSVGGAQPLDRDDLARLAGVCERYQPYAVSGHFAWSTRDGAWLGELRPLGFTEASTRRP